MKKLLLVIAILISNMGLFAQNIGDETIIDYEGYSLRFTVTSVEQAECAVSGYEGEPVDVTIPSTVTISGMEFSVTSIGENAFFECSSLTSIEILSVVTSIGNWAFQHCSSLTSIEIPSTVISIGDNPFVSCPSLTSIVVESGNTFYDSRNNCNAIIETGTNTLIAVCQNTVIPNSVTSIGDYAFGGCSFLTSIEIPDYVTSIGYWAFSHCSSLSINFGDNSQLTSIGDGAFRSCSKLTSIEIPNSVTFIGDDAFYSCENLTSIDFGENSQLTTIGERAFSGCSSLTSIEIPNSVSFIGENAFRDCKNLTSIDFGDNSQLTSINDYVFCSCDNLTSIEIPNTVTSIGNYAFYGCSSLTNIELPSGVDTIGGAAFYGCSSLTSIEIPSGVTYIGSGALGYCDSLTSVYCYAENVPETNSYVNVFAGVPSDMIIYVPSQSVGAYQAASPWNEYTIKAIGSEDDGDLNPTTFFYDFENGNLNGLNVTDANNDKITWEYRYGSDGGGFKNEGGVYSGTYAGNKADDYLVTASKYSMTETSEFSFVFVPYDCLTYFHEKIAVVVSEDGEAFETVWSYEIEETVSAWDTATIDLKAYAGKGLYIGLHHYGSEDGIRVDNLKLTSKEPSVPANLTATIYPENTGEITGTGAYNYGDTVTLTAKANEGYKFSNWTENGEVVSTYAEYSFIATKDRNLVANFVTSGDSIDNRKVLIEIFTGRSCPYDPDAHLIANEIEKNYPDRVYYINVHAGGYSPTTYPNLNTSFGLEFLNAYSINAIPSGLVNRTTKDKDAITNRSEWQSIAEQQLLQQADVNIDGIVKIREDERIAEITVDLDYVETSNYSTNYLTIMMLQDSIWGSQSGGVYNPEQYVDGQYCHMHVLRDIITPIWGDSITQTTAGTSITKTYIYEIPEIIGDTNGVVVDLDNIYFLAFVTEREDGLATRPILNVNKLPAIQGSNKPIYPFIKSLVQENTIACTKEKKFTANIVNGGTESLTSIKFEICVNNGTTTTYEWTGYLPVYENISIDILAEIPFGGELVSVKIIEANGTAFSYEKSIMAKCEEWIQVELDNTDTKEEFKLELAQDRFGNQITWQVVDINDNVIAQGGPYELLSASGIKVHEEYFTIKAGECVKFIIEDNVGNGITSNNFGQGYYKIYDSKGNILVESDGNFGLGEYHIIYVHGGYDDGNIEDDNIGDNNDTTIKNSTMRLANIYSVNGLETWNYGCSNETSTDFICINEFNFAENIELLDSIFYDERGNIIKIAKWEKVEGEWICAVCVEYEYNDKNQKTSRTNYNNFGTGFELGGIYRYNYDEEGKMISWALEFFNIPEFQKCVIEYNEEGQKIAEVLQNYSFETYYLENLTLTEYEYDDNGNMVRSNEFYWDGAWVIQASKIKEYDEYGNCTLAEQTTSAGTVQERRIYTYDTSVSAENVFYYSNPENDFPQLPEVKKNLLISFEYWSQDDKGDLSYVTTYMLDYENLETPIETTNHWVPDESLYANNMSVIGLIQIDSVNQNSTSLEIGAFCGEEVRGSQIIQHIPALDKYLVFLTIHGDSSDEISFKLYDHSIGQELDLRSPEAITFAVNGTLGSVINPYVLNFNNMVEITAVVSPSEAGVVTGAGIYAINDVITLTTTPYEGFSFKNWTVNGNVVSTDLEYSFVVTEAVELVANYNYVHTRELKSGWSWFSSFIEIEGENGLEMMTNAFGANGSQIKNQTEFVVYSDGGWYGSLMVANSDMMFMLEASAPHSFTLFGPKVNPEELPITIGTNWRWLAYPLNISLSVEDALGTIVPQTGDYVKSKGAFSQYYEGIGWLGALNTMNPGEGYMYQNVSGTTKTLVYPSAPTTRSTRENVTAENNYWIPEAGKFATNMSVIAVVENNGIEMSDYEVAAFVGDEVRGSARPIYIEALDRHMIFMTVYGNSNERIEFKYYDLNADAVENVTSREDIVFADNATYGSVDNAVVLTCGTTGINENDSEILNVYPNPANVNAEISLGMTYDRVEVYNAIGIKVAEYADVNRIGGIETAGVYVIKVMNGDETRNCRIVVR